MNNLLLDEKPLVILPEFAVAIGLNGAIFMQQLHYWLMNEKIGKVHDGRKWVRNTHDGWRKNFPFWSERTIRRIISSLEERGLILTTDALNSAKYDQTKWYTIDYDRLDKLTTTPGQIDQMDVSNLDKPIPETNSETTRDLTAEPAYDEIGNEFGDGYTDGKNQQWQLPRTGLAERALVACGKKKYATKIERSAWLAIEKAILPLSEGVESIYPLEWVEAMIEWAEKQNHSYRKNGEGLGVRIRFSALIGAIKNEGTKLDWVSRYKELNRSDEIPPEGLGQIVDDESTLAKEIEELLRASLADAMNLE